MKTPGEMTARAIGEVNSLSSYGVLSGKKFDYMISRNAVLNILARLNAGGSGQTSGIQRKIIGNLLTRWELMANDFKSVIDENERNFYAAMHDLVKAVDGGEFWPNPEAAASQPELSKPPCHVCGEPMKVKEWKCACGATTGCSEAQPLQPRCPKCGSEVGWESKGEVLRIWCANHKEHDIYIRSLAELSQFFSAPPAMPANHRWNLEHINGGIRICEGKHDKNADCEWTEYVPKVAPASPQLEQVAQEIYDSGVLNKGDREEGYVDLPRDEWIAKTTEILQRHFPGSEGADE